MDIPIEIQPQYRIVLWLKRMGKHTGKTLAGVKKIV